MATLPVTLVALVAFVAEVAVDALPIKSAVIVPAVKSPLPSLETIELTVLELVAVVALLLTFPAVVIVESFESEIDPASFAFVTDEFAKSPVAIDPSRILEESTASAAILSAVNHRLHQLASFAKSIVSTEPSLIAVLSIVPGPEPPASAPHVH